MRRLMVHAGILVTGAIIAVGCATGQSMSAADAIAARQKLMKENGALWKNVQDKTKAGQVQAAAADAAKMSENAKRIASLFPPGSLNPEKSAAKPEIWQKWPEFEAAAKNFETKAAQLRDTAQTGNAGATNALVKDFGRQVCGTCHTPFRVPPKQQ